MSRGIVEIADILAATGQYTMCNLPHYRYDKCKQACRRLERAGFIKKSGRTQTGINFKATGLLKNWKQSGSRAAPDKWLKKHNALMKVE